MSSHVHAEAGPGAEMRIELELTWDWNCGLGKSGLKIVFGIDAACAENIQLRIVAELGPDIVRTQKAEA
jgi:hypothetical protein